MFKINVKWIEIKRNQCLQAIQMLINETVSNSDTWNSYTSNAVRGHKPQQTTNYSENAQYKYTNNLPKY